MAALKSPFHEQDAALLGELIIESPPEAPTKPTVPQTTTQKRPRPVAPPTLYFKVQTTIALTFAMLIAGLLWITGAFFTLQALETFGIKLAGIGVWQWFIPIAITASELALWPRHSTAKLQFIFFVGVLLFDIGTSFAGLIEWGADRTFPLFEGITIPDAGWGLRLTALVVALIFAFGPELWKLWK